MHGLCWSFWPSEFCKHPLPDYCGERHRGCRRLVLTAVTYRPSPQTGTSPCMTHFPLTFPTLPCVSLPPLVPMASRRGDGLLWGCRSVARVVVPWGLDHCSHLYSRLLSGRKIHSEEEALEVREPSNMALSWLRRPSYMALFIGKETFIHGSVLGEGDLHTRLCSWGRRLSYMALFTGKETFIHDPVHGEGDLHTWAYSQEGDLYTGP